jgi:hypothetical protein
MDASVIAYPAFLHFLSLGCMVPITCAQNVQVNVTSRPGMDASVIAYPAFLHFLSLGCMVPITCAQNVQVNVTS